MRSHRRLFAVLATVCIFHRLANAEPLRIVTTGDSQTVNYSSRLPAALSRQGLDATVASAASSGATSLTYTGQAVDLNHQPQVAHDFASDTLAQDPDVILFMLGTNDAIQDGVDAFKINIGQVFDRFAAATNSAGAHPQVIVATEIPILDNPNNPNFALANQRLSGEIIPWLVSAAAEHGFELLDLNRSIQQQSDWQSWYSDDSTNPGYVHLWADIAHGAPGYIWMANEFAGAVKSLITSPTPVPEPSSCMLVIMGGLAIAVFRFRGKFGTN